MILGKADLGVDKPMVAILKMAIPSMGLFVFNGLLHLVDTVFVSWLGELPTAAMSFTAPINLCMFAMLECVGSGAAALMGQSLGRRDVESAKKMSVSALAMMYFMCILMMPMISPSVSNAIFTAIGAGSHKDILSLCWQYNAWVPIVTIPMGYTYVCNTTFRAQGDTVTPFKAIAIANTINLILDPLFIFTFNLGISGAAIATLVSRIASSFYLWRKLQSESAIVVPIMVRFTRGLTNYWKSILWIGIPVALSTASVALGMGSVNKILATFGHRVVSSWMLGMRVEELAFNFVMGINVAFVPYVAFNYGKRDLERLKAGFKSAYLIGLVLMCSMSVVLYIYPHIFLALFRPLPEIEEMASRAIRASIPSYPFVIFTVISSAFFTGTGYSLFGTITQLLRSVVFRVTAVSFFATYLDFSLIWWFQSTAGFLGSLVSMLFFIYLLRKIKKEFSQLSLL